MSYSESDCIPLPPSEIVKPDPLMPIGKRRVQFEALIDKSGGPDACWPWLGWKNKDGYGEISLRCFNARAHRVAYRIWNGEVPEGLRVCHRCDNPPCCNPKHLFLGTDADNVADRHAKGRSARGDAHGSKTHSERVQRGINHHAHLHPEKLCQGDDHWTRKRPGDVLKGEKANGAKLTAADVLEIRRAYSVGEQNQVQLAAKFGVRQTNIAAIIGRHTWKHLAP